MRRCIKNAIVMTLVIVCLMANLVVAADDPTYESIDVDPEEPEQESEVTFTVIGLTGDDIEEVYLNLEECTDTFCHPIVNISMTESDGTWSAIKTLDWDDAIVGHCWLVINSNGTWYEFKKDKSMHTNFTILPAEEDDGTTNGDNGDDNGGGGIPGFEIIAVLAAIAIAIIILRRKRS